MLFFQDCRPRLCRFLVEKQREFVEWKPLRYSSSYAIHTTFPRKKSACRHISGLLSIYMYTYTYIRIHVRVTTSVTCMYMYMYMTRACMLWAGIPCFYSTTMWEPVTLENTPQLFYSLTTYK